MFNGSVVWGEMENRRRNGLSLNLGFSTITSPISGRAGLRQVNPGSMVRDTDANALVTITQVRPIEMACNHAFPTKAAGYLDQYKGKGPADAAKLSADIATIAKATGSCNLATDAVKRSITTWQSLKGTM